MWKWLLGLGAAGGGIFLIARASRRSLVTLQVTGSREDAERALELARLCLMDQQSINFDGRTYRIRQTDQRTWEVSAKTTSGSPIPEPYGAQYIVCVRARIDTAGISAGSVGYGDA